MRVKQRSLGYCCYGAMHRCGGGGGSGGTALNHAVLTRLLVIPKCFARGHTVCFAPGTSLPQLEAFADVGQEVVDNTAVILWHTASADYRQQGELNTLANYSSAVHFTVDAPSSTIQVNKNNNNKKSMRMIDGQLSLTDLAILPLLSLGLLLSQLLLPLLSLGSLLLPALVLLRGQSRR